MTPTENELQESVSDSLNAEKQPPTNLNSKRSLLQRLRRGRRIRARFVESHISKSIAFQIRGLREREGWSQQTLAEKIGSNQNAIYRAENPNYGKQTITTLKKIAAEFDVALVVRFVAFSELLDWVSGTPHVNEGLNSEALDVSDFDTEDKEGKLEIKEQREPEKPTANAASEPYYHSLTGLMNPSPEHFRRSVEAGAKALQHYLKANYFSAGTLQDLAGLRYKPAFPPAFAPAFAPAFGDAEIERAPIAAASTVEVIVHKQPSVAVTYYGVNDESKAA